MILFKNIIVFFYIFLIFNIYQKIKLFVSWFESYIDFKKNKNNLQYIIKTKLRLLKYNKKKIYPKISIIIPIYNRQRYLLRCITNIQNQIFNEIEIIFVDDCSIDNSNKNIEEYIKKDKRIILLKNKINKGTFINRNIGVLYSKGKYIIFCDPDDILSKNILNICYKNAEKYNYELVRYMTSLNLNKNNLELIENKPKNKKELKLYLFYRNNKLDFYEFNIWNKFIKKIVYIRALNSLNNYALNLYLTYGEDFFLNYFLYKEANSFIFLKKIGYYYIKNSISITENLFSKSYLLTKFRLFIFESFFKNTKNNKYEKDIINLLINRYFRDFKHLVNNPNYYSFLNSNFINIYLKNKFINNENKYIFQKIYKF